MKKGFTIIEIIFGLLLASLIFTTSVPLIFNTISANKSNKLKTIAYHAANRELENLKYADFNTLENYNFQVPELNEANGRITIDKIESDLAEIKSQVFWNFNNKNESIELTTYLYGSEL